MFRLLEVVAIMGVVVSAGFIYGGDVGVRSSLLYSFPIDSYHLVDCSSHLFIFYS
jgi:hypothetical protein